MNQRLSRRRLTRDRSVAFMPVLLGPSWRNGADVWNFFAPRMTRFIAGILTSVTISDFLHRAFLKAKEE
jgi:hypothetical protein